MDDLQTIVLITISQIVQTIGFAYWYKHWGAKNVIRSFLDFVSYKQVKTDQGQTITQFNHPEAVQLADGLFAVISQSEVANNLAAGIVDATGTKAMQKFNGWIGGNQKQLNEAVQEAAYEEVPMLEVADELSSGLEADHPALSSIIRTFAKIKMRERMNPGPAQSIPAGGGRDSW